MLLSLAPIKVVLKMPYMALAGELEPPTAVSVVPVRLGAELKLEMNP